MSGSSESPPKVLHVTQPIEDGVARVVADLARRQVADGWDVSVACPSGRWLAEEVISAGGRHLEWSASRGLGPQVLREIHSLSRVIRGAAPDVVHLHSSKAGLAGRIALHGRIPTVFSPHAWSFFHVSGPTGRAALAWERAGTRWADVVLCCSEAEMRSGVEAGIKGNFRVIPNSSQIDNLGLDQDSARTALGLAAGVPIVVCFGRYAHQKGQDVLLEAWPIVRSEVPDAQLVLVGSGPEEQRLRSLAAPDVRFVPAGDRSHVVRWILSADVLAFPSRWEGMPLAVLEALELGRAVVVSDCQGMAEALVGGAGLMVPRENPVELAGALTRFASDRELCRLTGMEAGQRYREVHGSARAERFTQYSAMLNALIAERR